MKIYTESIIDALKVAKKKSRIRRDGSENMTENEIRRDGSENVTENEIRRGGSGNAA